MNASTRSSGRCSFGSPFLEQGSGIDAEGQADRTGAGDGRSPLVCVAELDNNRARSLIARVAPGALRDAIVEVSSPARRRQLQGDVPRLGLDGNGIRFSEDGDFGRLTEWWE